MIFLQICCIGEALSKAEVTKAELEVEINKLKSEEATLRDALLKMQALNEGLGQDKIELNKIIMQVSVFCGMSVFNCIDKSMLLVCFNVYFPV